MNTLNNKHNQFQKQHQQNEIQCMRLLEKNKQLIKQFSKTKNLDKQLEIKDIIKKNKKKLAKLKKIKHQYYINNSHHIFEYFDNKKIITSDQNKKLIVNQFFNINTDKTSMNILKKNITNYLHNVDDLEYNKLYIFKDDICNKCNTGEFIKLNTDGVKICNNCGHTAKIIVENIKSSYKDPPKDVSFYAYKRINHFREILAQFQAKETTTIPDELIEKIKKQIEKERISLKDLTNKKTKEILKHLGYNKYYEHISYIKDKLGIRPPHMSTHLEDTLCNLFLEIQIPYAKYCPNNRVNFLNYYYTIYKLCEMLNQTKFLPYFPMLKDREKILEQDIIWKQICNDLEWNYIPTV
tara:strand:+ start:4424 stop:5479 length:1056 start_codon:yes stop_codon:yes gene_type:complete